MSARYTSLHRDSSCLSSAEVCCVAFVNMSDDEEYAKLLEGTILEVPKAKRPRKSADPAPEPELVTLLKLATSPHFWFPDGNVVIVARDSLAFKVHRGVLARHSAVIDNLFRAAKPPSEKGQSWDGCPVVHIPDSPKDFEWLLMALYDGPRWAARVDTMPLRLR